MIKSLKGITIHNSIIFSRKKNFKIPLVFEFILFIIYLHSFNYKTNNMYLNDPDLLLYVHIFFFFSHYLSNFDFTFFYKYRNILRYMY